MNSLPNGVPTENDYKYLIESDEFRKMEVFSNQFILQNKRTLKNYSKKWVLDPLHQWSRQWEYPFVYSNMKLTVAFDEKTKILDAGSGITFFPFYISSQYNKVDVHCVDNDSSLVKIFKEINTNYKNKINFSCSNLANISFEDRMFDIIYCVSVLEHTRDYKEILDNFFRILKPAGKLIVTFDVSLDGTRDINFERGEKLVRILDQNFSFSNEVAPSLNSLLHTPNIFTTLTANNIDTNLLPWKYPKFIYQLHSWISRKRFGSWPPPLTVFCLSMTKPM